MLLFDDVCIYTANNDKVQCIYKCGYFVISIKNALTCSTKIVIKKCLSFEAMRFPTYTTTDIPAVQSLWHYGVRIDVPKFEIMH